MGEVWLADDPVLRRQVAVKILCEPPDASEEDQARRRGRLLSEARLMAALDHPSILPVYLVEEEEKTRSLYFTMKPCLLTADEVRRLCETVLGCPFPPELGRWEVAPSALTLSDLLYAGATLSPAAVVRIGLALTDALAYSHGRTPPIVHRDVKPANILFDRLGKVYLADFGVAKKMVPKGPGLPSDSLTVVLPDGRRSFVGTAEFAAPEQREQGIALPASDFYSLGLVLYRALVGRMPGTLTPPSKLDPGRIAPGWDRLFKGLLEIDPAKRLIEPGPIKALLKSLEGTHVAARRRMAWLGRTLAVFVLLAFAFYGRSRFQARRDNPLLPDSATPSPRTEAFGVPSPSVPAAAESATPTSSVPAAAESATPTPSVPAAAESATPTPSVPAAAGRAPATPPVLPYEKSPSLPYVPVPGEIDRPVDTGGREAGHVSLLSMPSEEKEEEDRSGAATGKDDSGGGGSGYNPEALGSFLDRPISTWLPAASSAERDELPEKSSKTEAESPSRKRVESVFPPSWEVDAPTMERRPRATAVGRPVNRTGRDVLFGEGPEPKARIPSRGKSESVVPSSWEEGATSPERRPQATGIVHPVDRPGRGGPMLPAPEPGMIWTADRDGTNLRQIPRAKIGEEMERLLKRYQAEEPEPVIDSAAWDEEKNRRNFVPPYPAGN